jgi:hypothetical protein
MAAKSRKLPRFLALKPVTRQVTGFAFESGIWGIGFSGRQGILVSDRFISRGFEA